MVYELGYECLLRYDEKYKKALKGYKTSFSEKSKIREDFNESQMELYGRRRSLVAAYMEISNGKE